MVPVNACRTDWRKIDVNVVALNRAKYPMAQQHGSACLAGDDVHKPARHSNPVANHKCTTTYVPTRLAAAQRSRLLVGLEQLHGPETE
jgi:hypothetical protein